MTKVKIKIEATSKGPYVRYHGVSIDEDLPKIFWKEAPDKVVGTTIGYFRYETEVDLDPGRHYVVYGNSSVCKRPYFWNAVIYVNDQILIQSSKVCRDNQLEGYFTVPQRTFLNRIISKICQFSIFGVFKKIAGGKFIKTLRKKGEKK